MKPTNDNFWLFISVTLSVIIVGTAGVYAFRPFGANAVTQENVPAAIPAQTQSASYGQSSGCGVQ